MKSKPLWKIQVSQRMETVFETEVPITILTEASAGKLARALIVKHALDEEEIVEEHLVKKSKRFKNYSALQKSQSRVGNSVTTSFSVQCADWSVVIFCETELQSQKVV